MTSEGQEPTHLIKGNIGASRPVGGKCIKSLVGDPSDIFVLASLAKLKPTLGFALKKAVVGDSRLERTKAHLGLHHDGARQLLSTYFLHLREEFQFSRIYHTCHHHDTLELGTI